MKKNYQEGLSATLVCILKVILGNKSEGVGKEREGRAKIQQGFNLQLLVLGLSLLGDRVSVFLGTPRRMFLRIVPLE